MAVLSDSLLQALQWRYATKKFDSSKKIPAEQWDALEKTLQLSPSSFGLQPWKFIVVQDSKLRASLKEHSWGQPQIVDASHMVVFCMKKNLGVAEIDAHLQNISNTRGTPLSALADYRKMMVDFVSRPKDAFDVNSWATKQTYIALGMFLESTALMGIDACPMEGINSAKYDEILGLANSGYATVVVATAGYRSSEDPLAKLPKVRFPLGQVVEHR